MCGNVWVGRFCSAFVDKGAGSVACLQERGEKEGDCVCICMCVYIYECVSLCVSVCVCMFLRCFEIVIIII